MKDANTYYANEYIERTELDDHEWVKVRNQYLTLEFDPLDKTNFLEAITNCENDSVFYEMADLLRKNDFESVGRLMLETARKYWIELASKQADADFGIN